jgi:hypothetical protein
MYIGMNGMFDPNQKSFHLDEKSFEDGKYEDFRKELNDIYIKKGKV